jgi:hypothetical protein
MTSTRIYTAAAAFAAPVTRLSFAPSSSALFRGAVGGGAAAVGVAHGLGAARRSAFTSGAHPARLLQSRRQLTAGAGGGGGISALLHGFESRTNDTTNNNNVVRARDISTSAVLKSGGNAPTTVAFADLDLCAQSQRAIKEVKGFEFATAVQDQTLRPILEGKDCLARAKTGSGKTIGFLLPAIETMMRNEKPPHGSISVLILSPTRELATQIYEVGLHNVKGCCTT